MYKRYISVLTVIAAMSVGATAQTDSIQSSLSPNQVVSYGGDMDITLGESTGAVSVIGNSQINRRSAKNISNDILGQGNGMQSLQNAGRYAVTNPTFYVRGLQTLNDNNTPLFIVDGIERDINTISAEEVENVYILKDATATALYGNKGINGVIVVNTKRGVKNSKSIKITYDHVIDYMAHKPKFLDGAAYGNAINEARKNDGLGVRYQPWEIQALADGSYPYLYPNVNWVDEVFRDKGSVNKYTAEFRGGTEKFQYYAMGTLLTQGGFIKRPNTNEGYSTQDKFSRGNIRMNLDIELTPTTKLAVNVLGSLSEDQQPGNQANLWDMVYTVPSAAFPIKAENGMWAGSSTWAGTMNPVAQSTAAAYYKNHTRTLFADMTIKQDLSPILKGLGAQVTFAYDNTANMWENHSKEYRYADVTTSWPEGQDKPTFSLSEQGKDSQMNGGSGTNTYHRFLHFDVGLNYKNTFGKLGLYSQLKWDYEYTDPNGVNNTVYRQNISWWTHLNYANRYMADLTLVETGSSRLAPGTKWAFSPTLGLSWVASNEAFWTNPDLYLKVRASAGLINSDFLPKDSNGNWVWSYYTQSYVTSGITYPFTNDWNSSFGQTALGQMATANPGREKAYKYNVGIDFGFLNNRISGSVEYYLRKTRDLLSKVPVIAGSTTVSMQYQNIGDMENYGIEFAINAKPVVTEDFTWNISYNVGWNHNMITNLNGLTFEVGGGFGGNDGNCQIQKEGYPANSFNLYQQVYDSAGKPIEGAYVDQNGDGVIDSHDRVVNHSKDPKVTMTMSNNFRYKNWDLGFTLRSSLGQYVYAAALRGGSATDGLFRNNNLGNVFKTDVYFNTNHNESDYWLRNANFLRCDNITLGYTFDNLLREKLRLRLFAAVQNPFVITKYEGLDPEVFSGVDGNIYPRATTWSLGLVANF